MGVHSVQCVQYTHTHSSASGGNSSPQSNHSWLGKTKENAYYMRIYRKQAHKKETLGPLLRKNMDKVMYNTYFT